MSWDIGIGSEVKMHYRIRLEDGTVAVSSFESQPLQFTMGDGTLVKGLEHALYGLRPGDKQTILISPEEGYGFSDETKKQILDRGRFPNDITIEVGAIIAFDIGEEEEIPGAIMDIAGDKVHVDFNHPLAGHEIQFEVEIFTVGPPVGMQ